MWAVNQSLPPRACEKHCNRTSLVSNSDSKCWFTVWHRSCLSYVVTTWASKQPCGAIKININSPLLCTRLITYCCFRLYLWAVLCYCFSSHNVYVKGFSFFVVSVLVSFYWILVVRVWDKTWPGWDLGRYTCLAGMGLEQIHVFRTYGTGTDPHV